MNVFGDQLVEKIIDNCEFEGAQQISKQFLADTVGATIAGLRQQLMTDIGDRTVTAAAAQAAAPALVLAATSTFKRFTWANPRIDSRQPTDHPIPASFAWPNSKVGDIFVLWEYGDGSLDIGPYKYIHPSDVITNAKKSMLSRITKCRCAGVR
jgi:hypothetical protein